MKKTLLIISFLLLYSQSYSQEAIDILKKSYQKCQSVKNGYYEMTKHMKYMSNEDTLQSDFKCYFKKLKDDSVFSSAFYYQQYYEGKYTGEILYNGNELVYTYLKDSTATIISKDKWTEYLEAIKHNYMYYPPLSNGKRFQMPTEQEFSDTNTSFEYLGEETINQFPCFHIKMIFLPEKDDGDAFQIISVQKEFWINKQDYIPVQYNRTSYITESKDTMIQYENFLLEKYKLNHLKNMDSISIERIPKYYKHKDYVPYTFPKILPLDTIAPDWTLPTLNDDSLSLNQLKGKLVLIDFFYKSCAPCVQALPLLQSLNVKYKEKGLEVIGINPYDDKEKGIAEFLAKRGVTYTVLLEAKEIAKKYRISGYPTLFLIDKNGKIIHIQIGYGEDIDEALEEIIKKNL